MDCHFCQKESVSYKIWCLPKLSTWLLFHASTKSVHRNNGEGEFQHPLALNLDIPEFHLPFIFDPALSPSIGLPGLLLWWGRRQENFSIVYTVMSLPGEILKAVSSSSRSFWWFLERPDITSLFSRKWCYSTGDDAGPLCPHPHSSLSKKFRT